MSHQTNWVTHSLRQHLFHKAVCISWDAHQLFFQIELKPPQTLMRKFIPCTAVFINWSNLSKSTRCEPKNISGNTPVESGCCRDKKILWKGWVEQRGWSNQLLQEQLGAHGYIIQQVRGAVLNGSDSGRHPPLTHHLHSVRGAPQHRSRPAHHFI